MRMLLLAILLALPLSAISQLRATSENKDEVYDFKFDKSVAKERAFKLFNKSSNILDFNIAQPLFSSIRGQNCKGKPARYVIVFVTSLTTPNFAQFVFFDVSNPNKWSALTNGTDSRALPLLIAELREPDFKSNILCGGG
ncbi:MAG: hypothetical protein EXR27_18310 [Betaproteobacteria bacterium]|nr:hypothetical protein [Betaproteobacteria bacterium]